MSVLWPDELRLSQTLCKPPERCGIEASHRRFFHISRRNRTPEENARRKNICGQLSMANIGGTKDIRTLLRETFAESFGYNAEI